MAADPTQQIAPPIPDSIPITDPTASQSIPIDLNPEYDPAKDTRAPFLKVKPNEKGPTISPAPDRQTGQVLKEAVTENIPQFSTRTTANPKYGKQSFLPDSDIMTAQQRREAPALAGGLDVASELASPATVATVAATAGLGEAGVIPKVLSGLFAGQIAASVYDQYPALKAAVDKAQHAKSQEEHDDAFSDAQRILTHMGADTVMGLLAAKHGAEGAKEILDSTTGSGVPDQASTFKAPKSTPAPEPEETHPEMNRETVKKPQDLGYSNQHITNFNIGEIRDILKNQTPAAEHPVSKPAAPVAGPDPDKFAEVGGKLVSTPAETPAATETAGTDPIEDLLMSDKIGGKKVRGATPKVEPVTVAQQATPRGLVERTTGDTESDTAIKTAGAIPAGNMAGLAMFHDPKTGSTLALKAGDVTPEAVQQHLAASRKSFGLVPDPDALSEAGGKFVGEQPVAASAQHPTVAALKEKFGASTNPAEMIKGGPSFLHADGTVTNVGSVSDHPAAISIAQGGGPQFKAGDVDRVEFINDTGSIRVRHRPSGKAVPEIVFSVPENGVTPEQVDMMKQAVGKMGRNGNLLIEVAHEGHEPSESARSWPENDIKEFARPSDVEPMLQKIGAHPDQQDIISKELQTPHKETYGMEVEHEDGTSQTVQIEAHSPKQAMATVQKQFPSIDGYREWRLATMPENQSSAPEDSAPVNEYSVPTNKLQKMKNDLRPAVQTVHHELGHAMVALNYGLNVKGMISSSHPSAPGDMRAGVLIGGQGLYERGPNGKAVIREDKRLPVLKQAMAGIAADEVFNDIPRSANHNFSLARGSNDAKMAFDILTEAGFNPVDAVKEMHRMIDENKEYLSRPEVSSVIKENANFRESGLSRQYHYSPERLQNMHAETRKRSANEKTTGIAEGSNVPTGAAVPAGGSQADVSGGEGGVQKATPAKPAETEERVTAWQPPQGIEKGIPSSSPVDTTMPLTKLSVSPSAYSRASSDNARGKGSKTEGPIRVLYNPDNGQYLVEDGMHRVVEAHQSGETSVPAKLWSGYSDTVANVHGEKMDLSPETEESVISEDYSPEQKEFASKINSKYKPAEAEVDGRKVREHVPNWDSISATLGVYPGAYEVLDGIREIPMADFEDPGARSPRIKRLAEEIAASKELNPLIVGIDYKGPYIIEGSHRFDALRQLGAKSFPAAVAIDLTPEGLGNSSEGIVDEDKIKKAKVPQDAILPPQPRLPDTGTYPAVQTDDGGIYFDPHPEGRTHIMFAQEQGIPPERIVSGGWLKDGDYEGSERSDAGRWGEQARAKIAVAEHRSASPKEITPLKLKRVDKSEASETGYVYHATNEDRAYDIAKNGLKTHKPSAFTDQDTWPDGAVEKRNYFTRTAEHTWQFAPEEGKPVLIRTKPTAEFKTESTGDAYTKRIIKPESLEILGEDNNWHPITSLKTP